MVLALLPGLPHEGTRVYLPMSEEQRAVIVFASCCRICGRKHERLKNPQYRRTHIMGHIYNGDGMVVDGPGWCGFCGAPADEHQTDLKDGTRKGIVVIDSKCPFQQKISLGAKGLNDRAENYPLYCPACPAHGEGSPTVIFKYNLDGHVRSSHGEALWSRPLLRIWSALTIPSPLRGQAAVDLESALSDMTQLDAPKDMVRLTREVIRDREKVLKDLSAFQRESVADHEARVWIDSMLARDEGVVVSAMLDMAAQIQGAQILGV